MSSVMIQYDVKTAKGIVKMPLP